MGNGVSVSLFAVLSSVLLVGVTWGPLDGTTPLVAGPNINMVSGISFPGGDPFLQRQNEPSGAVSTRNPLHIVVGANDYRAVNLPGTPDDRVNKDSWLGLFKSFDGGKTWQSTLLPGFPRDTSAEGVDSPLLGKQFAADPVVRAGTNGMFYYSGIAANRTNQKHSVVFVARLVDCNNKEGVRFDRSTNPDPIKYIDTRIVASAGGKKFLDKPWLAVDVPRDQAPWGRVVVSEDLSGGPLLTQRLRCGNVYVAYTLFTDATDPEKRSDIYVSRSADCGETWETAQNVSGDDGYGKNGSGQKDYTRAPSIHQGATLAIDPVTGTVHVAWRRFQSAGDKDAILVSQSANGGRSFTVPAIVAEIQDPADRPTLPDSQITDFRAFRTNAFPAMAVDATGRVYIAWSQRTAGPDSDPRIVISNADRDGKWSTPVSVDPGSVGHQITPVLSSAGGTLTLLWYDFRDDVLAPFGPFPVQADAITPESSPRHTVDVRSAQASPGANPIFVTPTRPSTKVSRYLSVIVPSGPADTSVFRQLRFNPPHLPVSAMGTKPLFGDYIDLIPSPVMLATEDGAWAFNTSPELQTVYHAVWTDNRDVVPPTDGDWSNYSPPAASGASRGAWGGEPRSRFLDRAGMRNQNIYTAILSRGLVVGSMGNSRPLRAGLSTLQTFPVFVQNLRPVPVTYRLTLLNQPPGGRASFLQFSHRSDPVWELDVTIPAFSSIARTVSARSTQWNASLRIDVVEIEAGGVKAAIAPEGDGNAGFFRGALRARIVLNPDPSNPPPRGELSLETRAAEVADLDGPSIVRWPSLTDRKDPARLNSAFLDPGFLRPALLNPALLNPAFLHAALLDETILTRALLHDPLSPAALNPVVANPALLNPSSLRDAALNPRLIDPALRHATWTDITWTLKNAGNETSHFGFAALCEGGLPAETLAQLLVYRLYRTPVEVNGRLSEDGVQVEVLANILDPELIDSAFSNAFLDDALSKVTFSVAPADEVRILLRVLEKKGTGTFGTDQVSAVVGIPSAREPAPLITDSSPDRHDRQQEISKRKPLAGRRIALSGKR